MLLSSSSVSLSGNTRILLSYEYEPTAASTSLKLALLCLQSSPTRIAPHKLLPPVCQHQQLKRNSAMAPMKCSTGPARESRQFYYYYTFRNCLYISYVQYHNHQPPEATRRIICQHNYSEPPTEASLRFSSFPTLHKP